METDKQGKRYVCRCGGREWSGWFTVEQYGRGRVHGGVNHEDNLAGEGGGQK